MSGKTFAFAGSLNRNMPDFAPARGAGIETYAFDETTGRLTPVATFTGIDNPSFLAIDVPRRRLYACTEWAGRNEGVVTALEIDPVTGALSYINIQPALGSMTCHVSIDRAGDYLFASNYTTAPLGARPGAAISVFPIRDDGGLAPAIASNHHQGPKAVLPTGELSHAHSAVASPDNRHVLVPDLGLDRVVAYRLPPKDGRLALAEAPFAALPKGSGPRHLVFAPGGRIVYVINELASTLAVFDFEPVTARMELRQTVSTLPKGAASDNACAELVLSPDGRFLYASNRGHDSIVCLAVGPEGKLGQPSWTPSGASWPRNLTFDPSGHFLIAVNQHGDAIVVFRQDPASGALFDTGQTVQTGTPMRLVFGRF